MAVRVESIVSEFRSIWVSIRQKQKSHQGGTETRRKSKPLRQQSYFSITLGTLKNSPSLSGAFFIASACGKHGTKISSRQAGAAPSPGFTSDCPNLAEICAIGGTSDVSSSFRRSM